MGSTIEVSLEKGESFCLSGGVVDEFSYREPDPNKKPPKQLWEERYATANPLYGTEPLPFLKSYHSVLKKGKALDIAMGEGRNAVYLAQQGFQVTGIDLCPTAIERATQLASAKSVSIEAKVQNLDFYLVPLMHYDTILMTYFRPLPRFFSEILRGLSLGGTVLLEAYTIEHYKKHPNPLVEFEDCYKPNELIGHMKSFQILYYKEIEEPNESLVQVIARKFHK